MNNSGYSGKPLVSKLGYKPGEQVYVVHGPAWFRHELQTHEVVPVDNEPAAWAHVFCKTQAELQAFLDGFDRNALSKGFWVSWPKKSSGVATDLTEQTFRDIILPLGWVDTKVCAVDETWSGLKFLRRKS